MTEIQKSKVEHFFDVLDHDGNGVLEQEDFELVSKEICNIRNLAPNATERLNLRIKAQSLFVHVLNDLEKKTAVIEKEEWFKFFNQEIHSNKENHYVSQVSEYIFSVFDQDSDGYIDEQEYMDMFKAYGLYSAQAKKAFDMLDLNSDRKLSKGELVKAFEDFFLADNESAPGNWIFGDWRNEIDLDDY